MNIAFDKGCRWIEGDVKAKTAEWCGCPTKYGSAWCADHYRVVYVRTRAGAGDVSRLLQKKIAG